MKAGTRMTHAQARKIAIQAIEAQIKVLAFDANMHERLGVDTPHAVKASVRRRELRAAIVTLQAPEQVRIEL